MHKPWAARGMPQVSYAAIIYPPFHITVPMPCWTLHWVKGGLHLACGLPYTASKEWVPRSNALGLYNFCFSVFKWFSFSCSTLYLQFLCCLQARTGRREETRSWVHSSCLIFLCNAQDWKGQTLPTYPSCVDGLSLTQMYRLAFWNIRRKDQGI